MVAKADSLRVELEIYVRTNRQTAPEVHIAEDVAAQFCGDLMARLSQRYGNAFWFG
jgi:hypothetical protein